MALAPVVAGSLETDVIDFCARLIRFDTSNFGGNDARPERPAAEWVATILAGAGYAPEVYEAAPGRASTVLRIAGADRAAPALLVHGHLDVVPAHAPDWTRHPFSGEISDGAVWGRGALDIKQLDAMMLASAVGFAREGFVPPRDIVLAFVADEEDNGDFGAGFLVEKHPELFEGVASAVGESGGYSVYLPDGSAFYPVGCAERGTAWLRLTAHGRAGHGSRRNDENAITRLAGALVRITEHPWPVRLIPSVRALLDGLQARLDVSVDPADPGSLAQLGEAARLVENTVRNSANPTMLSAGYKANVIPGAAVAVVDGRVLAGADAEFIAKIAELVGPDIEIEFINRGAPVEAPHRSAEFAAIAGAIRAEHPEALVLPFCMTGGTDAKAFTTLGIDCYGFAPGDYAPDFAHWRYVHGVDEHIPVQSLHAGARMLDHYLRSFPQISEVS